MIGLQWISAAPPTGDRECDEHPTRDASALEELNMRGPAIDLARYSRKSFCDGERLRPIEENLRMNERLLCSFAESAVMRDACD